MKNIEQIEHRANILKPRIRKFINLYCETKSEIRKSRLNRIIQVWDKEFNNLESEYRKAKKKEFDDKKLQKQFIEKLTIIETCRRN